MRKQLLTATVLAGTAIGVAPVFAGSTPLSTVQVASGLDHTTQVTYAPGDSDRLYIVEKQGRIKVLDLTSGTVNPTLFLNIDAIVGGGTSTNNEQGLLGLAFHPDHQDNGQFYVYYTNNSGNTTIARYNVTSPDVANPGSASVIMSFNQPEGNHNGGWIDFSPIDGYLYIASGDGGGAFDQHGPFGNGQSLTTLLGKILRIDVDVEGTYGIPSDNPYAGIPGPLDEIWAYGLRNPWRSSFDRETGDLYIGDVGQGSWEEINFQPASSDGGENYGWRCMEGDHCTGLTGCTCFDSSLTDPIHEYAHSSGLSITGGIVYRGCAIPDLQGTYFFADYAFASIWSFRYDGSTMTEFQSRTAELAPSVGAISRVSSFGEDADGELYIVDQGTGASGEVYKIVAEGSEGGSGDADLDGSGSVGFADLLILLAAWGDCTDACCDEDLDGDGTVAFADLLILLAAWG